MATFSTARTMPLPPEVVAALASGQKIEAIALLRKATGLGLREAKEVIDRHVSVAAGSSAAAGSRRTKSDGGAPLQGQLSLEGRRSIEDQARVAGALAAALKEGDWGRAIKQARQLVGGKSSAATQAIDRYKAMRPKSATPAGLSPGEVPYASEWKTWVTVITLAVIAYFVLLAIFR